MLTSIYEFGDVYVPPQSEEESARQLEDAKKMWLGLGKSLKKKLDKVSDFSDSVGHGLMYGINHPVDAYHTLTRKVDNAKNFFNDAKDAFNIMTNHGGAAIANYAMNKYLPSPEEFKKLATDPNSPFYGLKPEDYEKILNGVNTNIANNPALNQQIDFGISPETAGEAAGLAFKVPVSAAYYGGKAALGALTQATDENSGVREFLRGLKDADARLSQFRNKPTPEFTRDDLGKVAGSVGDVIKAQLPKNADEATALARSLTKSGVNSAIDMIPGSTFIGDSVRKDVVSNIDHHLYGDGGVVDTISKSAPSLDSLGAAIGDKINTIGAPVAMAGGNIASSMLNKLQDNPADTTTNDPSNSSLPIDNKPQSYGWNNNDSIQHMWSDAFSGRAS